MEGDTAGRTTLSLPSGLAAQDRAAARPGRNKLKNLSAEHYAVYKHIERAQRKANMASCACRQMISKVLEKSGLVSAAHGRRLDLRARQLQGPHGRHLARRRGGGGGAGPAAQGHRGGVAAAGARAQGVAAVSKNTLDNLLSAVQQLRNKKTDRRLAEQEQGQKRKRKRMLKNTNPESKRRRLSEKEKVSVEVDESDVESEEDDVEGVRKCRDMRFIQYVVCRL